MERQPQQPFDSIESAYDFFRVLSEAVAEAKQELEGDIKRDSSAKSSRRLDALRVAYYSVEKLEFHITRSRRILNDLRSLRRLLFEERAAPKVTIAAKPVKALTPAMMATPAPVLLPSKVARVRAKGGRAVAA
jgi:hypothetical protein